MDLWGDGYSGRMKVVRNEVAGIGVDYLTLVKRSDQTIDSRESYV